MDLLKLVPSGKFSDFTIVCNDHSFLVHKAVLFARSRSSFFRTCVDSEFKESQNNLLVLEDVINEAFSLILASIYLGRLPRIDEVAAIWPEMLGLIEQRSKTVYDLREVELLIKVYTLADRFMMEGTRKEATSKIIEQLSKAMDYSTTHSDVAAVLRSVYTAVGDDPYRFRAKITATCAVREDLSIMSESEEVRKVVEEEDPAGWAAALEAVRIHKSKPVGDTRRTAVPFPRLD